MAHVIGSKRYQYFEKETGAGASWGTRPTTPVLVHCPTTAYGVKLVRNVVKHNPFAGRGQRHHAQNVNSMPKGTITMPLYGAYDAGPGVSLAEYFLDLAIDDQETLDPRPSIRAFDIHRDGAGTTVAGHEQSGLRVNKMTLKGQEGGMLELSLDVSGKDEVNLVGAAAALPDDRNQLLEFLFQEVSLTLGGVAILVTDFSWEIDWGLKEKYLNSTRPSKLSAQHNVQSITLTPLKESNTYDAFLRLVAQTEQELVLTIKGLHSGTGTALTNYVQGVFTFPRASLEAADDNISPDDFGTQSLKLDLFKPDTTADTVSVVWSDVA